MSDLYETIHHLALNREEETIRIRHHLHENPELSSKEYETAAYLKEAIEKEGLLIEDVPNSTGFTALLDTGRPGKTIGLRADLDALPVKETDNNLARKRLVQSKVDGIMHACGHDGHMAISLTTIKLLKKLKDQLNGKVYFIFEEGEEIGSGIDAMLDHLKNKKLDAIYGNHLASFLQTGEVSLDSGPKMAGLAVVNFYVHGKGGHGSRPDLSVNPVFAGANILSNLSSAWANQIDVTKTVTLGITTFQAGEALNVIPDKAYIGGTLRFYDEAEGRKAGQLVRDMAESIAQAHGCTVSYGEKGDFIGPPVINDAGLSDMLEKDLEGVFSLKRKNDVQWFASESFSRYRELCPTLFTFVGMANETYGSGAEHHNEYFDLDDEALKYGVMLMTKFAVDYLGEGE